MRIVEKYLYHFNELNDKAKQSAVNQMYDLNVDYDWWNFIYDDAKNVDLKISVCRFTR